MPRIRATASAKRAWARGSYLHMADEPDAAYEDEPEQPAEPESVS